MAHTYPSPVINHEIGIVKIDRFKMFEDLSRIAPAKVYSQIISTLNGEREIELPDHPESIAEQSRVHIQAKEIVTRYYLIEGTRFEITPEIEDQIEAERLRHSQFLNEEKVILDPKLFYLENIFTRNHVQLGQLTRAIHEISMIRREHAAQFAQLFRYQETWVEHLRIADAI